MAAGDKIEAVNNDTVNTTLTLSFTVTPAQDSLIVFWTYARVGTNTVATPPSGFTLLATALGSAGWPIAYCYAKVAGASETNSYSVVWTTSDHIAAVAYNFAGTLTLGEVSAVAIDGTSGSTSGNVPAAAMSATNNAFAVAFTDFYQLVTSLTYDNGFTKLLDVTSSLRRYSTAEKTITGPDSDIQTLLGWTTSSGWDGIMVVVEPTPAGGTTSLYYYLSNQ